MGRLMKGEIGTAIRMLQRNRGRSMLTMFGIIIGVASVVTVVAIGQGVTQQVAGQTQRLGSDLITIRPGQIATDGGLLSGFGQLSGVSGGMLSMHDFAVIAGTHGVKTALPLSVITGGITVDETKRHYDVPVLGTSAAFPDMLDQSLAYGTFLNDDAANDNKVILGAHTAEALFTQNVPLGQTVSILGQEFIVAGILNESQAAPLSIDPDFNDAVFMSNDAAQALTNNNAHLYEIFARPNRPDQTDMVVDHVRGALLAAHGGQEDFTVLKQSQTIAVAGNILALLTALIGGVALIAMLVGGVGIMNVMLVSITERMHEIGIRKAVGATNREILRQFVIEAAVLCVAGALFGVLLAMAIAVVLNLLTNLTPVITWQAVTLSCLASIAIGIVFGAFPAVKASRKDPISALRDI